MVVTEDQKETDRYWNAIVGNGGAENACAWCNDHWGFFWQITPRRLLDLTTDADRSKAKRAFAAMKTMTKNHIASLDAAADGRFRTRGGEACQASTTATLLTTEERPRGHTADQK